jgi:RNA-directed DNA polymerase
MGIKINNVFKYITSSANLYEAAHKTLLKGLRFKANGAAWKWQMEYHLVKLQQELSSGTYVHGKYQSFTIYDPKERNILAAQIKDRVVHHALNNIIEPVVDRKFIYHSYACRKGKGQHMAMRQAKSMLQANTYFMHLDVKKFFYNIHRSTLLGIISKTVHDEATLGLIEEIVNSATRHAFYTPPQPVDLFNQPTPDAYNYSGYPNATRGIPIGNLCSQVFANWYMNELDQFVKHQLKMKHYIRYMDDFVLFGNNKSEMQQAERHIHDFVSQQLKLQLHASGGAARSAHGLTFLGFRIFTTHTTIKSASVNRFRKKLKHFLKPTELSPVAHFFDVFKRTQAWNAHALHADSFALRSNLFNAHRYTRFMLKNDFNEIKLREQLA